VNDEVVWQYANLQLCRVVVGCPHVQCTESALHTGNCQRDSPLARCAATGHSAQHDRGRLVRRDVHSQGNPLPHEPVAMQPRPSSLQRRCSEPLTFNPERFLDEYERLQPGPAETRDDWHCTFGFGRRACVGKHGCQRVAVHQYGHDAQAGL
jgi:hypothetical protein